MPMHPRPSAETSNPCEPSFRRSILVTSKVVLSKLAGHFGALPLRLANAARDPAALRGQVPLERGDLIAAAANQLELAVDVADRLGEDLTPADRVVHPLAPFLAQRRAGALGARQLPKLLECHAEEVLEAEELAQTLDVVALIEAMRARRPRAGGRQKPDLLVIANRPRRRPGRLSGLADPHQAFGAHQPSSAGTTTAAAGAREWRGRMSDTPAPTSDVAASTQSAVCMLAMKGASFASERPEASPEKILNSTSSGTAAVMIASTKAIEITAPVFWSMVRAPAAIPRRCAGTDPIIAAVLGELNIPDPTPTTNSHTALSQYAV